MDAAAVRWSIGHYLDKKATHSQVWKATVADIQSPDPSTVVFTLKQPWNEFPIMFTTGPGMIVAPSSMATGTFTPDRRRSLHSREVRVAGRVGSRCPAGLLGR